MMGYRGLGTNWVVDSSGQTIDCDSWGNILSSACWGFGAPISSLPPGSPIFGGSGTVPQPKAPNWSSLLIPAALAVGGLIIVLRVTR